MPFKATGKLPSGKYKELLQQSPNYKNGAFQNLSPTPMKTEGVTYWKMMREFWKTHPDTEPESVPFIKTNLKTVDGDAFIVWFGHSSYLLKIGGKTFLVDPVFSGNAAPFSFMVKAFKGADEFKVADMPAIDYLILTHDHYDHLDFKTIRALGTPVRHIYCSLGLSAHLSYWGISSKKNY